MTARVLSAALILGACSLAVSATAGAPDQHASSVQKSPAASSATAAAVAASATVNPGAGHWTYDGDTGVAHWAELSGEYSACSAGQQSPVDLSGGVIAQAGALQAAWKPMALKAKDTGHGVQVDADRGSSLRVGDHAYNMLQFHVHTPSEHTLDGQRFPMEIHFVHKDGHGELAVVGVLVREGVANAALQPLVDELGPYKRTSAGSKVDPSRLLPPSRGSYRYHGSLTTPPCSEIVEWVVMDTPIQASAQQIAAFAKAHPNNARPVQPLNRRIVLHATR